MEGRQSVPGAVIVVSDRCLNGEREDTAGPAAVAALAEYGVEVEEIILVPEGMDELTAQLRAALAAGVRVIITAGGTGVGPRNFTPEATKPLLELELPGVATQILLAGLAFTPQAGLSRGLVGLTGRGPDAAVILNAPSSRGGVQDAVGVLGPLLPRLLDKD